MLNENKIIAFVTIYDVDKAKEFYGGILGLRLIGEERPFALVYDANGIMIRLVIGNEPPQSRGTVLGWEVPDADAAVKELIAAGVVFERYGFVQQNELGIWTTPTGAKVAWFKDPDGNILGISEHPEHPERRW